MTVMTVLDRELTLDQIEALLFDNEKLAISEAARQRVEESCSFLSEYSSDKVIYGINTGFGPMAQYRVPDKDLKQLQYNIIRSHSTGAGEPLPDIYVKAAMIARIVTFVQGLSGIHWSAVALLTEFVNRGIYPKVPSHGSVGASGDLVQLAHIALALIGEGEVHYNGRWHRTSDVMKREGLRPARIFIREGLALTNGTSMMTGIALVNLIYGNRLVYLSMMTSSLINETVSSYWDFLDDRLQAAKRHGGQSAVAKGMRDILEGSQMIRNRESELYDNSHEDVSVFDKKVQPYYSLRCVPQILGPVYETLANAEAVVVDELNSSSDNPVVDRESGVVLHGGNFHGDYVSLEMDKMKTAITKMTMLAERQLNYLMHDKLNGILPPFVNLGRLGLNYGMQAAQFTATSTTAECQTLSMPNYVHSIPNNNDNQDIVSMGTNSALITAKVIDNSFQVFAIHSMALANAVDALGISDRLAPATREFYEDIRKIFPAFSDDKPLYRYIEHVADFLKY